MSLAETFHQQLRKYALGKGRKRLLLAVSGGIDSVVLTHLTKDAGLDFAVAHCNFQLRGAESERDEDFVRKLASDMQVPFYIERFDTIAIAEKSQCSIQEAARTLRYDWFAQLRKEHAFDFVALAHHADDSIETILMHFFRGTGLQGLTGIPPVRDDFFIRPLLSFRRHELEGYANEYKLRWMEDSSNESNKYTRNFFRNELLPAIRQVFPQADDNLLRNAERIQSVLPIYHLGFETIKKKLAEEDGQVLRMPILKLQPYLHTAFLFELLQDYGFTEKQLPDIRHLADATNGRFVRSQTHQVIRHNRWLIVAPLITDTIIFVLEEGQTDLHFTNGIIGAKRYGKEKWKLDSSPYTAQLDAKAISFPMVLRRWKAGDYFYPLGMKKKKKLARFFIDNKLSKNEKENIWILESNRKIAWVIGHRIDDRFKVSDQTQEVLEFKWTPLSEQSSTSRR